MKLTFSYWDKTARANEIFGEAALRDNVLDDTDLRAAGLDQVTLQALGAKADGTGSSLQLVLGAALQKKLGLSSSGDRKGDAQIVGMLAEWTSFQGDALKAAAEPYLKLRGEQRKRAGEIFLAFGDHYRMRSWIESDPSAAAAFIVRLASINGIKREHLQFFSDGIPADPRGAADLLASILPRVGADRARLSAAHTSYEALLAEGVTDLKAQRDAILFVDKHISRKGDAISFLLAQGVKLSTLTEKTIVDTAVAAITKGASLDPSGAAALINEIHDSQGRNGAGDSFRERIIAALPDAPVAAMLSGATDTFYPSTFAKTIARAKVLAGGDMHAWFTKVDPDGAMRSGILTTLARFRQADVVAQASDLFADQVFASLSQSDRTQYLPLAVEILKNGKPAGKAAFEAKIVALLKSGQGRDGAALALRMAKEAGAKLSPAAEAIAASLPAVPKMEAPVNEWLKDGAVTAVLFCYPQDGGAYPAGIANYYVGQGFEEKNVRAPFGLERAKTRVFEKVVNGVVQRIVITSDQTRNRNEVIADDGVDIVVHRGHSYHLGLTFDENVTADPKAKKKLLFGGSCYSNGSMTSGSFQAAYGQHLILSDADVGQAAVNNPTLKKVLDGVAQKRKSFRSYGLETSGIVAPDSPELQLSSYELSLAGWSAP